MRSGLAVVIALMGGLHLLNAQAPSRTKKADESGWTTLFDGKTLNGWRGFKTEAPPSAWKVVDGTIALQGKGGDLMTVAEYGDFELELEWKLERGGNSGIIYRVATTGEQTWATGPEMQVLDNAGHADGKNPITSAGSAYAVYPPTRDVTKPIGEWNSVRLVAKGSHIEHWLNGVKVVDYELGSPDWLARVKASKFATMPDYGRPRRGHIALQDHGDPVWYRNLRIR